MDAYFGTLVLEGQDRQVYYSGEFCLLTKDEKDMS